MKKGLFVFFFWSLSQIGVSQAAYNCEELLSRIEQAYREGKFDQIRNLKECLGVRISNGDTVLHSRRMRLLVEGLEQLEGNTDWNLGMLNDFGKELRTTARARDLGSYWKQRLLSDSIDPEIIKDSLEILKTKGQLDHQIFSQEANRRAYILMGQTYLQLGAEDISQFIARRLLKENPSFQLRETIENQYFKRIVDNIDETATRISVGVSMGFHTSYPVNIERANNVTNYSYSLQNNGRPGYGLHMRYYFDENFSIGLSFLKNNDKTEYHLNAPGFSDKKLFLNEEVLTWHKFPISLRWILEKESKEHVPIEAKPFVEVGISPNWLSKSRSIVAYSGGQILTNYDVRDRRNKLNIEAIIGGGMRTKLGRSYLTFGIHASYGLRGIVNKNSMNSPQQTIFDIAQIVERNYHLFTIFGLVGYEYRINIIPKNYKKIDVENNKSVR